MSRLSWGSVGDRFYEAGIDRGVLYPVIGDGVSWPGLISVNEAPSGADAQPFYQDGIKYLNVLGLEEFSATIAAFSSPPEFNECDGTVSIANGLFATQQPRKPFGLSYRTRIGNDTEGLEHAYKLHLVYNAIATPSSRENKSLGVSPAPIIFSWGINTVPMAITSFKPSAHLVIDSRQVSEMIMLNVEDYIYGNASLEPKLPTPTALIAMLNA